jgi:hypothetical protein
LRYLEREPRFTVIMILITGGSYVSIRWLQQRHTRRARSDEAYRERLGEDGLNEVPHRLRILKFLIPAIGVFAGYVGFATGSGVRIREGLREGTLRSDHRVVFVNGEEADVRIVGLTGNYLLYVPANGRTVLVAPVQAVVRSIEHLQRAQGERARSDDPPPAAHDRSPDR